MKSNMKIAMVQMNVLSDVFGTEIRVINVKHACEMLENTLEKDNNIDIIILPEEFYAGAGYGPISLQDDEETIKKNVFTPLAAIAIKHDVNIVGALSTKFEKSGFKGNNIGFVIDREGNILKYQERFHQTESEKPFSFSGTEYTVLDLDCAKIGVVIGVDILYPEIARNFALLGAELIVNPILAPGTKDKDKYPDNLYRNCSVVRALENQIFVATVNGVGEFAHVDMPIFGESVVAGPLGKIVELDSEECAGIAVLKSEDKEEASKNMDLIELRNSEICCIR